MSFVVPSQNAGPGGVSRFRDRRRPWRPAGSPFFHNDASKSRINPTVMATDDDFFHPISDKKRRVVGSWLAGMTGRPTLSTFCAVFVKTIFQLALTSRVITIVSAICARNALLPRVDDRARQPIAARRILPRVDNSHPSGRKVTSLTKG